MLFSIIVPIYNVEKYLRKCLDSIRNQTFKDYEVIMVDDGSTDGCGTVCDEYCHKDIRFKVIHKENGGLVSARKAGAEIVSGDYVLNVDSDDYIDETLLEKLMSQVISYRPDVIAFGYKTVDEGGTYLYKRLNDIECGFYGDNIDTIKNSYLYDERKYGQNGGCLIFSIWTKLVKKDIYQKCQSLVDNRISKGEDTLVNLYILNETESVLVSEIIEYNYRQQPTSMTHVFDVRDIENQGLLVDGLRQFGKDTGGYHRQIDMYIFYSTYMLLQKLVDYNTGFSQYKIYVRNINESHLFSGITSDLTSGVMCAEKIKVLLVKKKLWFLLYVYFKMKRIVKFSRLYQDKRINRK